MQTKPKLLILSHVLPFPRRNGQQQRVFYTLQAVRARFHTIFLTAVAPERIAEVERELRTVCDEAWVLPSLYARNSLARVYHRLRGAWFALRSGLKVSNYQVGELEFASARLEKELAGREIDAVLFEYWHATAAVPLFRRRGIPCVLDMHNVLWQSHLQKLEGRSGLGAWWKRHSAQSYRRAEEAAWHAYDGIVAITREEYSYVEPRVPAAIKLFYAPMGVDMAQWPLSWRPADPPRVAFYGGLGSLHNQQSALRCYEKIMPQVWEKFPEAELWLVGSNPPAHLEALTRDRRVKVTGFVEKVQDVLCTMRAVLCPWVGTDGFRSRLIEVMALGVPVIATPDAIKGMELEDGRGLMLATDDAAMAGHALRLLEQKDFAREQSRLARAQVERLYGMANTYGRLTDELHDWVRHRRNDVSAAAAAG